MSGAGEYGVGRADLACRATDADVLVEVVTDVPFTLVVHEPDRPAARLCTPGATRFLL